MHPGTAATEVFIGRQPLYDRALGVAAYELLYRGSATADSAAGLTDADAATAHVFLTSLIDIGIDRVGHDRPVVVKLSPSYLGLDLLSHLPAERVWIEVLPDRWIEGEALAAVQRLAESPFRLVIRDPIAHPALGPIAELADVVKVDVTAIDTDRLPARMESLRPYGVQLLADKVETHTDHAECQRLGFDLFQGFFLAAPKLLAGRRLSAERLSVLELLSRLQEPTTSVEDLEAVVRRNVALSYQLLRYVNSAFVGLRSEVDSIRRAIVLLGPKVIRQIASLMLTQDTVDKPLEVTRTALVRARMAEGVGELLGDARPAYYVAGLFSTLDALLDVPLDDIVTSLPLTDEVVAALLYHDGPVGRALAVAKLYERCDWDDPAFDGFDQGELSAAFMDAVAFADESVEMLQRVRA